MRNIELAIIAVIVVILAVTVFAHVVAPYDPYLVDLDRIREGPSSSHLCGTDAKGRDILSRVLYGGRISLGVAGLAALLSLGIGLAVGLAGGYAGGWLDSLTVAVIDFVLSFPSLLLAIAVSLVLPPGTLTVMIAIAAVGWASFARIVRGQVLTLRTMPYVEAARAVGCSPARIVARHILPQCLPLSIVMLGLKLGGYILTEASLSFLGLGPQPPLSSWGRMISDGRAYILTEPWIVIVPGVAIVITALSLNLLGDLLRDRYGDPAKG